MAKRHESVFRVRLPVPRDVAMDWYERPGIPARLSPPWQRVPLRAAGESDRKQSLWVPFGDCTHDPRFLPDESGCVLEDRVSWCPPPWARSQLVARHAQDALSRLFAWRHRVTCQDLARLAVRTVPPLTIGVSGASGFIGRELCAYLTSQGHRVLRFVRGRPAREDEIAWDPAHGRLESAQLAGLDAVINLAGAGIADARWTLARKHELVESRVQSTGTLARAMARANDGPRVLVSATGIGAYGDRGDETLDETSPTGRGFLSELARGWEHAAAPATEAGVRVVHARIGIVLSPRGGALAKLAEPFRFGAGGRLGDGRAWWSWIGLHDLLDALLFAVETPDLRGVVNAVAPEPVRQGELARVLGRVLARPALVAAPAFALRLLLGREQADEMLLASQRVRPAVLLASGFRWREPRLDALLESLYGRVRLAAS